MPATGWLWAPGTMDAATLIATATYDIGLYTRQADMTTAHEWLRPGNESDRFDESTEVVTGTNGHAFGYGNPTIKWSFHLLTPGMVNYIRTTNFPSGARSYPATIAQPFNRAFGATVKYYTARAYWTPYSSAELAAGGLNAWVIEFRNATEIAGP